MVEPGVVRVVLRSFVGVTRPSGKAGSRSRRMVVAGALSLMTIGRVRDAQALPMPIRTLSCSVCGSTGLSSNLDSLAALVIVADTIPLLSGIITGAGSTLAVANGTRSPGWFVTSYVFGGLNLAAGVLWATVDGGAGSLGPPTSTALSISHLLVATVNIVLPTIGFARPRGPQVAPVAIGGRDAGGRLWSGIGLQVVDF